MSNNHEYNPEFSLTQPNDAPRESHPHVGKYMDSKELAEELHVPESWIRGAVRSRALDPIPCLRFGRYVRFQWGDPELLKWLERRRHKS